MADQLVGCYQHVSSENLEEFLETMDIPGPMRSMMANTEPKVLLLQLHISVHCALVRLRSLMMETVGQFVTKLIL